MTGIRPDPKAQSQAADEPSAAVAALADSLALLAAGLPEPAFLLDRRGIVVAATKAAAGLDAPEVAGARFTSLVSREHQSAAAVALSDAISPGIAHALDLPLLAPRGGVRWFHASFSPIRLGERVEAALVTLTDVSERRREEERLRRSEELMVDTQGTAHLGTWEWDPKEPYATWSPELYRIYGLDAHAHAPSYQDYLTRVHPDDRERVMRATESVFKDFKPYSHDERVFRPDGSMRYLHTWAKAVLDDEGKLAKLVGVCQDVTDRKLAEIAAVESEARYRSLVDNSPLGIGAIAADGTITEANPRLRAMLGSADQDSLARLLDADGASRARAAMERILSGDSQGERVDARAVRADGSVLHARLTLSPVKPANKPPFIACLVEDVTREKEIEEAAALADSRLARIHDLEEVSGWKAHLLNVASHEIKSPLTPIKIQLHMLKEGKRGALTPEQQRAVDVVYEQADRLSKLASDVLDVAQIDQGKLAMRSERVDLGPLARSVAGSFREAASEWKVALEVDAPDGHRVKADPDRLQQVLFNLLSNAFKFTPSGGRVRVRVARDGPHVRVSVADTGPGVPTEVRNRLFQAFSQVHEPGAGRERGTGLGLYISKSIVDAHGGRIWVESEEGRGSTFHVALPAEP